MAVLALNGMLSAADAPVPVRPWIAIAASFATGYCALALIAGGSIRISSAEILAFTTGLAIMITSLSALAVSIVGIPITQFVVVFVGLPLGVLAYVLRRPPEPLWRALSRFSRRWFDFSDYSTAERGIAVVLLAGIAVALAVFIGLAGMPYPDAPSMAIAITGPGGRPDLPETFARNVSQSIEVHVLANATPGPNPFRIRIALVPADAAGNESFHAPPSVDPLILDPFAEYIETNVSVVPGGTTTLPYSIALDFSGRCTLRIQLLPGSSDLDDVISEAYLSLDVTSP